MAIVSRRTVFGLIATRLTTVTNAAGYYGQIGRPLPGQTDTPADPPVKDLENDDLRVTSYFILFPGTGTDGPDLPLCGTDTGLDLDWRIHAAGGDVEDVLALVDRLDTALLGWIPVLAGVGFGQVRRFPGTRIPVLPDRTVSPERQFAPLQYQLTATT